MSEPNDPNAFEGVPQDETGRVEEMKVEEVRRTASLTLREEDPRETRVASMEAANRSLADALRVTYRGLQAVMILLIVLFVFSGFRQVDESERGVKVELGKMSPTPLEPGFVFSLPYPLGEVLKVDTSIVTVRIDEKFMPFLRDNEKVRDFAETGIGQGSLRPQTDGFLITADQNIALSRWRAFYERAQPSEYLRNLDTDYEDLLIRSVVERAIVQVVAQTPMPTGA